MLMISGYAECFSKYGKVSAHRVNTMLLSAFFTESLGASCKHDAEEGPRIPL